MTLRKWLAELSVSVPQAFHSKYMMLEDTVEPRIIPIQSHSSPMKPPYATVRERALWIHANITLERHVVAGLQKRQWLVLWNKLLLGFRVQASGLMQGSEFWS